MLYAFPVTMALSTDELKLENAEIHIAIRGIKPESVVLYVQDFKILFSSDKFSPVFSDSNPVLGQTVELLLAI